MPKRRQRITSRIRGNLNLLKKKELQQQPLLSPRPDVYIPNNPIGIVQQYTEQLCPVKRSPLPLQPSPPVATASPQTSYFVGSAIRALMNSPKKNVPPVGAVDFWSDLPSSSDTAASILAQIYNEEFTVPPLCSTSPTQAFPSSLETNLGSFYDDSKLFVGASDYFSHYDPNLSCGATAVTANTTAASTTALRSSAAAAESTAVATAAAAAAAAASTAVAAAAVGRSNITGGVATVSQLNYQESFLDAVVGDRREPEYDSDSGVIDSLCSVVDLPPPSSSLTTPSPPLTQSLNNIDNSSSSSSSSSSRSSIDFFSSICDIIHPSTCDCNTNTTAVAANTAEAAGSLTDEQLLNVLNGGDDYDDDKKDDNNNHDSDSKFIGSHTTISTSLSASRPTDSASPQSRSSRLPTPPQSRSPMLSQAVNDRSIESECPGVSFVAAIANEMILTNNTSVATPPIPEAAEQSPLNEDAVIAAAATAFSPSSAGDGLLSDFLSPSSSQLSPFSDQETSSQPQLPPSTTSLSEKSLAAKATAADTIVPVTTDTTAISTTTTTTTIAADNSAADVRKRVRFESCADSDSDSATTVLSKRPRNHQSQHHSSQLTSRKRRSSVFRSRRAVVKKQYEPADATSTDDDSVFAKPLQVDSRYWKKRIQNRSTCEAASTTNTTTTTKSSSQTPPPPPTLPLKRRAVAVSTRITAEQALSAISSSEESEMEFSTMPLNTRIRLHQVYGDGGGGGGASGSDGVDGSQSEHQSPPDDGLRSLNDRLQHHASDFLAVIDLNAMHDNLYDRHVRFLQHAQLTSAKCRAMRKLLRHDQYRVKQITLLLDNMAWLIYQYYLAEHRRAKRLLQKHLDRKTVTSLPSEADGDSVFLGLCKHVTRRMKRTLPCTGIETIDQDALRYLQTTTRLLNEDSPRSMFNLKPNERELIASMNLYRDQDSIFPKRTLLLPTKQYVRTYLHNVLRCNLEINNATPTATTTTTTTTTAAMMEQKRLSPNKQPQQQQQPQQQSPRRAALISWKHEYERFYYILNFLSIINYKFSLFIQHCEILERKFDGRNNKSASTSPASGFSLLPTTFWSRTNDASCGMAFRFYSIDDQKTAELLTVSQPSPSATPPPDDHDDDDKAATTVVVAAASENVSAAAAVIVADDEPSPAVPLVALPVSAATDIQTLLAKQLDMVRLLMEDPSSSSSSRDNRSRRTNDQFSPLERRFLRLYFLGLAVQQKQELLTSVPSIEYLFAVLEERYCNVLRESERRIDQSSSVLLRELNSEKRV